MDDDDRARLTVLMDAADETAAHHTPPRWRRAFATALKQERLAITEVKEEPGYTFDAYRPDGSPRIFAGTFRPPLEELGSLWGAYIASVGIVSFTPDEPMKTWASGAFDRPLYVKGS